MWTRHGILLIGVSIFAREARFEAVRYVKQAVTFKAEGMGKMSDNHGSEFRIKIPGYSRLVT